MSYLVTNCIWKLFVDVLFSDKTTFLNKDKEKQPFCFISAAFLIASRAVYVGIKYEQTTAFKLLNKSLLILMPQDEIARIRKRKRGRSMLNRSGNTTDNLCFRYRFRDVFSRFRCCVYNGTGPLFVHVKHNGNMELQRSC